MSKRTLLDITQTVLSSLDSDEINSISDTVESRQVLKIIQLVYEDIIARSNLPEHYTAFQLTASGTSTKPTIMTLPSTIKKLIWLKYNKETTDNTDMNYQPVHFLAQEEFMRRMYGLAESDDNVVTISHTLDTGAIDFLCTDDKAPDWYTTLDDYTLIFDSYDADVDTTLQSSKTMAYGMLEPTWTESDAFVPDLDSDQFPLLIHEAKVLAWAELKQGEHAKAEQAAKRAWTHLMNNKYRVSGVSELDKTPNYGRK